MIGPGSDKNEKNLLNQQGAFFYIDGSSGMLQLNFHFGTENPEEWLKKHPGNKISYIFSVIHLIQMIQVIPVIHVTCSTSYTRNTRNKCSINNTSNGSNASNSKNAFNANDASNS